MAMNMDLGPEDDEEDEAGNVIVRDLPEDKAGKGKKEEDKTEEGDGDSEQEASSDEDRPGKNVNESEEERRNKRREQRRQQKENRRNAFARKDEQIRALQETLAQTNVRLQKIEDHTGVEASAKLDRAIAGAKNAIQEQKIRIRVAKEALDTDAEIEAIDKLTDIKADLRRMEEFQEGAQARAAQEREKDERRGGNGRQDDGEEREARQQNGNGAAQINETVANNFKIFHARHTWFDLKGTDENSKIALAIDASVLADGFDPNTKDYWEELEDRIAEKLPKLAFRKNGSKQNGAPAMNGGGGRGNGSNGGDGGIKISKERVEAMKESGAWFDPARKKKMIESYARYDKEQASNGRNN